MSRIMNVYSRIDTLPFGTADPSVTPGALVLEGGAWRGLYTEGALDALMEEGLNFQTVLGISAGAMTGMFYVAGMIGAAGRMNLTHRHDSNYMGFGAMKKDHGVTGFTYMFSSLFDEINFDWDRFSRPDRKFLCAATSLEDGRLTYFDRDTCDIKKAVQASATVPYFSRPVEIDGRHYLDGGCSVKIPYTWPVRHGYEKIIVVRTRDRLYRKNPKKQTLLNAEYRAYEKFEYALKTSAERYNHLLDRIDEDEAAGKTFVFAPRDPVTIRRFEGNMEELGQLYWHGYEETKRRIPDLKEYLAR